MTKWSNNNVSPTPANGYQRRRQETRRLLLEAACTLFVERGVEHVSIDAITSTAGVAKGSFYNHFESREDLFNELVEETLQQMLSRGLEFTPPVDDRAGSSAGANVVHLLHAVVRPDYLPAITAGGLSVYPHGNRQSAAHGGGG